MAEENKLKKCPECGSGLVKSENSGIGVAGVKDRPTPSTSPAYFCQKCQLDFEDDEL